MTEYIDKDKITREILQLSRGPFQDLLGLILGSQPDEASLLAFAKKSPDRWGQLVAIVGRLAGFTEKLQVETTFNHKVAEMSDSDLRDYQARLDREYMELMTHTNTKVLPEGRPPQKDNGGDVPE